MKKEVAEKIVKGITDKIECNTVDIDDWAEFWGFTREEYEEFLDMAIKASEREPKTGHWILADEQNKEDVENDNYRFICSECQCSDIHAKSTIVSYCWNCGARMERNDKE